MGVAVIGSGGTGRGGFIRNKKHAGMNGDAMVNEEPKKRGGGGEKARGGGGANGGCVV